MNSPYREQVLSDVDIQEPKNLYRYILRSSNKCPVCSREKKEQIYVSFTWVNNPQYLFCHPLKRIHVRGMWWWKKYCPVDGVHHHVLCDECQVSWIIMSPDQSEAYPDIKDAYL